MNLILLAGNSIKNKEWILEVEKAMQSNFSTFPHFYKHWETGNEELIDTEYELAELTKKLPAEPYMIFAKSAGIILALKGIKSGRLTPEKCVFVGTPIYWAKENGFDLENLLKNLEVPALFVQHTSDPTITSADLRKLLENKNIKNYSLVELPGDSHHYPEIEKLAELTTQFSQN